MIYDVSRWCRVEQTVDLQPAEPCGLAAGLWVLLVSSGRCTVETEEERLAAEAGSIILSGGAVTVAPLTPCHLVGILLEGSNARAFAQQLEGAMVLEGTSCPGAAEEIAALSTGLPGWQESAAALRLLCVLDEADAQPPSLPPLVTAAVVAIRQNYSRLYGVEELSDQLQVSKEHLVRVFSQTMGVSPGRYLTRMRMESAKALLLHREYSLDVVATLCGYSGANYFCRVFKKEEGVTPNQWREKNLPVNAPAEKRASKDELELYL